MARWRHVGPIYRAIADSRLKPSEVVVVELLMCLCGGDLARIAYRNRELETRPWTAFGYQCEACLTIYVEGT